MSRYTFPALLAFIILLATACSVTPETTIEKELTPAVTSIPSPTITSITSVNDETNPSITVTWDPVEKADFYVFEYESAVDYLSAESEFKSFITTSNTFTIPSSAFTNSSDMRFIFKVKAAHKPSSSRSIIYSDDSEIKEAVVLNTFSISPIIQDNVLTIYSTFPKIKSVLTGENIIQPVIKYYAVTDGTTTELESNTIMLSSAENKTIRAELIVEDEVVATRAVSITNTADYYPTHLISLEATTNEKDAITLKWKANAVNAGLEEYNPKMRFYIERRENGSDRWLTLPDNEGETLYIAGANNGGTFTYSDSSAEAGKDYVYRVITQYVLTKNDSEISFDEKKDSALVSDIAYIQDIEVKSFVIKAGKGFSGEPSTGDATYEVSLEWEPYHTLPETMEYVVTHGDFDLISGNTIDESKEKYVEIYRGTDLSLSHTFVLTAEQNKTAHNYTYYVQIAPTDSSSDNPMTQAKKKDENGNLIDGIIKTNPSIKEVSFIAALSATNGETALSESVELKWEYNKSSIEEAGLDLSNVTVHILKRTSKDATYSDITESGINGTSYTDIDVESGNTYYYILRPYYSDTASPYNGAQSAETEKMAAGTILDTVKEVKASINTSNTSIEVSWTGVENAHGYAVYYREKGKSSNWTQGATTDENTTSCSLSSPLEAGVRYELTVSPLDSKGNTKPSDMITAEGEILGGVKNLKATGDENIQADSIVLTWDEVEGADSYDISIYDDDSTAFYTESIAAKIGTTYTLSATSDIIKAYSETRAYALSRKYYFTVTPKVGSMPPPEAEAEKVAGYWIMPPKNITAEKAISNDRVIISWSAVDDVDGYYLYYSKNKDLSDATKIYVGKDNTSYTHIKTSEPYYYTLSSMCGNIEGAVQTTFDSDDDNYGYPLLPPSQVSADELENRIIQYSFSTALGATSYKIKVQSKEYQLFVNDGVIDTAKTSSEIKEATIDGNGRVTCKINRPDITTAATIYSSVKSVNDSSEALALYNESSSAYCNVDLKYLENYEYVNLVIYGMSPLYQEANDRWDGDWWEGTNQKEFTTASGAVTFKRPKGLYKWGQSGLSYNWDNGTAKFTNYTYTDTSSNTYVISSGEIINRTDNTYDLTTPLRRLIGTITVVFPSYLGGKKTIEFDNYKIDSSSGTVKVNDASVDISKITNRVL